MTERVVEPCSPAKRGTPCNRLGCALTGAPQRGNPNPPPHTQGPRRGHVEYWKAQCGETRLLRLEGGKERKLLPILTVSVNCSVIRSLLLPGSSQSQRDAAKESALTLSSQNDRGDALANILCLTLLCPSALEDALARAL